MKSMKSELKEIILLLLRNYLRKHFSAPVLLPKKTITNFKIQTVPSHYLLAAFSQ